MKKILAVMMALICLIGITGCSTDKGEQSDLNKIIVQAQLPNVQMAIPEHYEVGTNEYMQEYYYSDECSVFLTEQATGYSLEQFVSKALDEYSDIMKTCEVVSRTDEKLKDETDCVVLELTYVIDMGDGDELKQKCYAMYTVKSGKAYILTCISVSDRYFHNRDDFVSIKENLVIE